MRTNQQFAGARSTTAWRTPACGRMPSGSARRSAADCEARVSPVNRPTSRAGPSWPRCIRHPLDLPRHLPQNRWLRVSISRTTTAAAIWMC